MDRNVLSIGLWTKNTGNLMSHSAGLSHEELQYIKNLKVGDRLIVWLNQKKNRRFSISYFKSIST